ncbi:Leucine-rich repeat-containing 9 [Schistosoma japonicum]|uniref:Leucine-rich repeat-containing 9 n=1 Tax=Schistosoma japonicum TaxID=6182 RepID=A0A4Z2CWM9_SCHJA|nr:Leucine-rich repeat-containing 9 [Schistosoma japonicum]
MNNLSIKQSIFTDYHLFVICPEKINELKLYMDIICYGFRNNKQQYKLTHSLNIADQKNLQIIQQSITNANPYQYDYVTRLLLIKVCTTDNNQNIVLNENNTTDEEYKENIVYYEKQTNCSCLSHLQSFNYIKNELIYPEFLIEVEYILKTNEYNTIIDQLNIDCNYEVNNNIKVFDKEIQADENWIKTTSSISLINDQDQFIDLNEILHNNSNLSQNSFNWLYNENTLTLNNLKFFKNIQFSNFSNL